jgi:hypothetical protein
VLVEVRNNGTIDPAEAGESDRSVSGRNNVLANASSIWYSLYAFVALVTPLELDFRGAASYNSRPFLLYGRGFGRQQIA